jgi:hypothetical protein
VPENCAIAVCGEIKEAAINAVKVIPDEIFRKKDFIL